MADVTVKVDIKHLIQDLERIKGRFNPIIEEVMNETMERVYAESQVLVPVNTGALKGSGRIVRTGRWRSDGTPEIAVVYGNEIVNYAVKVHEDLDAYHESPTQAKYLEIPLVNNANFLVSQLRSRLQVLLNS